MLFSNLTSVREDSEDEMSDSGPPRVSLVPRGGYPAPSASHARPTRANPGAGRGQPPLAAGATGVGNPDLLADRLADMQLNDARASRPSVKACAETQATARKTKRRQALIPDGSADPKAWRCFHTTTSGTRCSFDRAKPGFKFCTQHTNGQLDVGATNTR